MKYSDEEKERIVDYMVKLTNEELREFFRDRGEPGGASNKAEYRAQIGEWLNKGKLTYTALTAYLDAVGPSRSQHVYLLKAPDGAAKNWRRDDWVKAHLKQHGVDDLLKRVSLILPDDLTLSHLTHTPGQFEATAVARREGLYRDESRDYERVQSDGENVLFKAYIHRVERGLVFLRWDLNRNTATLHVTQLPTGGGYEDQRLAFYGLVSAWLDLNTFNVLDLGRGIKKLHELAETGTSEARPQAIDYKTPGGRTFGGRGASSHTSMLGETLVDGPMSDLRQHGVAHIGNFWWLPSGADVTTDTHVFLNAKDHRINFTTRNEERTIKHVLARIRAHCA